MEITKKIIIFVVCFIFFGLSLQVQASEESAAGIWHGEIKLAKYKDRPPINVMIHIYDSPKHNQIGYLTTALPVVYKYHVVPVEVIDFKGNSVYFESKLTL